MADRVIVEILVAAPIEKVWTAVKDPVEAQRWFGWDYPTLAADLVQMWKDSHTDEVKREIWADTMPDRFTFEAVGETHTVVRIVRAAPATDSSWTGIYDDMIEGWTTFMQQLKFALERHPAENRRTIFLNGRAKTAGTPHPIEALGLAPVWVVPNGERYEVSAATGDRLSGTVFYRAPHQMGLTVDGFGDGLLIVQVRPKTAKSAHGGGSVIVTTYGTSDADFAQLRDRWSRWWTDTYEVIEIQP
jgi:uncharacterized protein YndB with AHSA1/START domain